MNAVLPWALLWPFCHNPSAHEGCFFLLHTFRLDLPQTREHSLLQWVCHFMVLRTLRPGTYAARELKCLLLL